MQKIHISEMHLLPTSWVHQPLLQLHQFRKCHKRGNRLHKGVQQHVEENNCGINRKNMFW
jgi:hypothetical protein